MDLSFSSPTVMFCVFLVMTIYKYHTLGRGISEHLHHRYGQVRPFISSPYMYFENPIYTVIYGFGFNLFLMSFALIGISGLSYIMNDFLNQNIWFFVYLSMLFVYIADHKGKNLMKKIAQQVEVKAQLLTHGRKIYYIERLKRYEMIPSLFSNQHFLSTPDRVMRPNKN